MPANMPTTMLTNTPATGDHPAGPVDPEDPARLQQWLDHFGITAEQLREAVQAAGSAPDAVAEHLLNQGGSAGPG